MASRMIHLDEGRWDKDSVPRGSGGVKWRGGQTRFPEAAEAGRIAVEMQAKLVEEKPRVFLYQLWLSLYQRSLAEVLAFQGDYPEARGYVEIAIQRADE
jgi:hypothetical protein